MDQSGAGIICCWVENMKRIGLILFLFVASMTAQAEVTVKEFRGTGNLTTPIFTVESPWLLDWRLDGDYDRMVALDIALIEAHTGKHVGRVLYTKRKGNGVKIFKDAGQFQLRISSTLARWTLKVQQLQPEEEEQYTPKAPK
jgi:hypothetical protein